jgi:hypothetical protein
LGGWQRDCWHTLFTQPAMFTGMPLLRGEYRCIFSYYFECKAGPSRAFYFETCASWPPEADGVAYALLHVHYWEKPGIGVSGLPKHVNLRRAWPVDLAQLRRRAEGLVLGPLPPPTGMAKCDVKPWHTAMTQFLHRYYRADVDPVSARIVFTHQLLPSHLVVGRERRRVRNGWSNRRRPEQEVHGQARLEFSGRRALPVSARERVPTWLCRSRGTVGSRSCSANVRRGDSDVYGSSRRARRYCKACLAWARRRAQAMPRAGARARKRAWCIC